MWEESQGVWSGENVKWAEDTVGSGVVRMPSGQRIRWGMAPGSSGLLVASPGALNSLLWGGVRAVHGCGVEPAQGCGVRGGRL